MYTQWTCTLSVTINYSCRMWKFLAELYRVVLTTLWRTPKDQSPQIDVPTNRSARSARSRTWSATIVGILCPFDRFTI